MANKKQYQYLIIGDFLAFDEKYGVQRAIFTLTKLNIHQKTRTRH